MSVAKAAIMPNLFYIGNAIAKAHIEPHNATFELVPLNQEQTNYLCIVSHSMLNSNIEENINTNNLPYEVAKEYFHCRVHAIAATLISRLYPEK